MSTALDKIHYVGGHFFYLCVVECLDVSEVSHITLSDEVNRHTFTAKSTGAANAMDVVLTVCGEVVVDNE